MRHNRFFDHPSARRAARLGLAALAFVAPGVAAFGQAPGPESFATAPKTPTEFWEAADYLVRSGQPKLAVPYLNGFLQSNPDDATFLKIRDTYGVGSILRLQDDPATRAFAEPLLAKLKEAVHRRATDPQRLDRAVSALTRTIEEQNYGLDQLRSAGPFAVPALVQKLSDPSLSTEDRSLIVANMGRLDRSAVPALVAVLDAPDATLAVDAAQALGRIGDPRAIPQLTYPAARADGSPALREAARQAIERLTGRAYAAQPKSPVRLLTDEAWAYHRHRVEFPGDSVSVWTWQDNGPAPSNLSRREAETLFGLRFAREALALDPADTDAQTALVSIALESAAESQGPAVVASQDPTGAFAEALASGPDILSRVMRTAINDGHSALASTAALALARVTDRDALAVEGRLNPLVEALSAPDRRVQFSAASALVSLDPRKPFPGSSRVVPVLARFAASQQAPKMIVIDANITRANTTASTLRALDYDAQVAGSGPDGFRLATGSADVEAVFIDPTALHDPWTWNDTIVNLRADARTAGLPIFVVGPRALEDRIAPDLSRYPRTAFLVSPTDPQLLKGPLDREMARMGFRPLDPVERSQFAQASAALLAQIASQPGGPFGSNLTTAQPALTAALSNPETAPAASMALGDVPGVEAQRNLADILLDPSRPLNLRLIAGTQLARGIQRFGPLVTADQERRLAAASDSEANPALRATLASVIGALRPQARAIGVRLRAFTPTPPQPQPQPAPGNAPETPPPAAPEPNS